MLCGVCAVGDSVHVPARVLISLPNPSTCRAMRIVTAAAAPATGPLSHCCSCPRASGTGAIHFPLPLTLQHFAEESPLCYYLFLNAVFQRCSQISFSTTAPSIFYSSLNSSLISVTHDFPLSKHPCHFSIHWAVFNFPTPSNPSSAEVHSPSTSVPTSSQSSK